MYLALRLILSQYKIAIKVLNLPSDYPSLTAWKITTMTATVTVADRCNKTMFSFLIFLMKFY